MREYFNGWKRKFGILVLAMSCILVAVWLRSLAIVDGIELYPGSFTHQTWTSGKGIFRWSRIEHGKIIPRAKQWRFTWTHRKINPKTGVEPVYNRRSRWPWAWEHLGVFIWWQHDPEYVECHFPYSLIAIPSVLLSAFLLFSNRRNSSQKKTIESTATDGA